MTKREFFSKKFLFEDAFALGDYAVKAFPEESAEAIAHADEIASGAFKFTARWDMEKTWTPVVFEKEIDWLHQPGDDPEWVYAFNRCRFWITLGQAYALTKNEKYAEAFVSQLLSWISSVKRSRQGTEKAWRTIEAGLRLEYWHKAIWLFKGSEKIDDEIIEIFSESVREHAEYLMDAWDSFHLMSNWGVLENHGLFFAGVMLADGEKYRAEAARRMALEISIQIYRDGVHWEQSPMYHNEVLSCFLDVMILAKKNGVKLPDIFDRIREMCIFDLYAKKPNSREIAMGDSDEIDQRDILAKAAFALKDPLLKFGGYESVDFDSLWDLGEEAVEGFKLLKSQAPKDMDHGFMDSGNFYFRSSWNSDATFLHFHCGALGAGHGHADQLHFDLFSRGEDILIDPGRFTYVFGPDRIAFKEAKAHNVTIVDERDYYVCTDSWECRDLTRAVNRSFYADSFHGYAEGGHLAYMNPEGIFANRRVIFIKPDIVIIADEFYGAGTHRYKQHLHFNNSGALSGKGDKHSYLSEKVKAQVQNIAPGLSSYISQGRLSRHYGKSEAAPILNLEFAGAGFASAYTAIAISDPGSENIFEASIIPVYSSFKKTVFGNDEIEALELKFGKLHYILVIAHKEYASPTDTFNAGGCIGFGSAVLFNAAAGEDQIGTILQY
ncbi:MAG: heparinase II/III family protein [Clostridiales bacterium]|jgi:hypothetical protein|nr:heparinase II/III family protein [Clostridiales bacterium]